MKRFFNLVTGIIILWPVLYFSGCSLFNPDKYAKEKTAAEQFYLDNPGDLARVCALQFPAQPFSLDTGKWTLSTDTSIRFSVGKPAAPELTVIKIGPEADTVICTTDTVFKIINHYRTQTDTLKIKDVAGTDSLRASNKQLLAKAAAAQQLAADSESAADTRQWIIVALSIGLALMIVLFIVKLF